MAMFAWLMLGLAIWHFAVFVPDRFWGGIVGACLAAVLGAALLPFLINGLSIPGQDETTILVALQAVPGTIMGMALCWWIGDREERALEEAEASEPSL